MGGQDTSEEGRTVGIGATLALCLRASMAAVIIAIGYWS